MKRTHLSNAELKVQTLARRLATEQLLRVSWKRFRGAYEDYPRWQALSLWTDAICRLAGEDDISIRRALNKHLPGFRPARAQPPQCEPLALAVLKWVHAEIFGYARQEGWLDALIFYGVRHSHSQGVWSYWEHCEGKWIRERPKELPSFEQWWRSSLHFQLWGRVSSIVLNADVERYLDWEGFRLWLRPLFFHAAQLTSDVLRELERYCPGASCGSLNALRGDAARRCAWRRLDRAGTDKLLASARQDRWVDDLLGQVRSHPWRARMHAYVSGQQRRRAQISANRYPTFRRWKQSLGIYGTRDQHS